MRSRDLRVVLGSQLVSSSGSWAHNTALMVLLYELTHSAAWVAAGTMARYLPSIVFSGYGGVIAERFERVRGDMVARVFGAFFALAFGAVSLGALVTPAVLHAGLHAALLVFGAGVPALCLLALPRLLRADRVAAREAVMVAPRVAILERLGLFQNATRSSLEALAGAAQEITVPAGTVLIAEGDRADAFYVLTQGRLDVSPAGETGTEPVHLRTLEPLSYAREIGLLGQVPRTATVTATAQSTLLRIGGEDFLDALTNLSASPSLLEGARTRLALTHPSSRALEPLLHRHGTGDAGAAASSSPGIGSAEPLASGDRRG